MAIYMYFYRYNSKNPPVVLISLDGFRSDYIHRNLTPTLTRLRELGVRTDHMRSIYPTMTFPNHYTQVTVSVILFVN